MSLLTQQHFQSQCVFITGGTGFLGIALVTKIIKDIPCERILLLTRGGDKRFWDFCSSMLPAGTFQSLRNSNRIRVLDGDLQKPRLGLSDEALADVTSNATIYIHAGSSINLQRSLPEIAKSIVEPSMQLAEIALGSSRMRQFAYISTAYCNSRLSHIQSGRDTVVSESIYPLHAGNEDSTLLEHRNIVSFGMTPEFGFHKFPYAYAYAKHLTERLLLKRFSACGRQSAFLILRPSIIGPALTEPYPHYEIRGSAPLTAILAACVSTTSRQMTFSSQLPDAFHTSTFDEVPVDIVVNRLLAHLSRKSQGIFHAVAGASSRRSFATFWSEAMSERLLPWSPQPIFRSDLDWKSDQLHPVARAYVIIGTSYLFQDNKTESLWDDMSVAEKEVLPLWLTSPEEYAVAKMRRESVSKLLDGSSRQRSASKYSSSSLSQSRL